MNAHQINNPQFDSIVIGKKKTDTNKKTGSGYIQSEQTKLEKAIDGDTYKPKKYDNDFIKSMINYRTGKGWNQQAFAQAVQLQLPIIKGIESNNITYNSAYVSKINNYIIKNK